MVSYRRAIAAAAAVVACVLSTPRDAAADPVFADTFASTPFGAIVDGMAANSWARLNTNNFMDVWVDPADEAAGGFGSPERVILAWSSMAWDSNRGDLIFWGGGHANYGGNEVYRWSANTLEWERGSMPSEVTLVDPVISRYETVDGVYNAPVAAHTYDNNEFLPIVDRFVTLGGAAFNTGGQFIAENPDGSLRGTGPYFWDPSLADPNKVGGLSGSAVNPAIEGGQMWENRDNVGQTMGPFINGTTAYITENGKDVLYIGGRDLWKYTVNDIDDPSQDTYEKVGRFWNAFDGAGAGAFDPVLNAYVRTANGSFLYWDLDTAGPANDNILFTPEDPTGEFALSALYGMDYDAVRHRFVLWDGNGSLWELLPPEILGPTGWVVSRIDPAGLEQPDVSELPIFTGVLGKWKYLPELDLYAGVTDPLTGDIWIYKPEEWSPGPIPQFAVAAPPMGAILLAVPALLLLRRRRA